MSAAIEFRLLGPVEALRGGSTLPVGGPRQRALLALLLREPGRPVSAESLVEELWHGRAPAGAATTLRSYVSKLRTVLDADAPLVATPGGYSLEVSPETIDSHRFEQLAREGEEALARRRAQRAGEVLREALQLWRGRPFDGLADDGLLRLEAERLDQLRLLALEQRIEADLALGASAELVEELEALVQRASLSRAALAAADADALPRRASGGRARCLPQRADAAGRARTRAERGAAAARAVDPAARRTGDARAGAAAQPAGAPDELRRPGGGAGRHRTAARAGAPRDAHGRRRRREDAPRARDGRACGSALPGRRVLRRLLRPRRPVCSSPARWHRRSASASRRARASPSGSRCTCAMPISCSSSTTASTCARRAASSCKPCSPPVRSCALSPRAASCSGCRARSTTPCRRSHCQGRAPAWTASVPPTPSACCSRGRGTHGRSSRTTTACS